MRTKDEERERGLLTGNYGEHKQDDWFDNTVASWLTHVRGTRKKCRQQKIKT